MCSITKPIVDRLESELDGQADVLRVDFLSEVGREVAHTYRVSIIPTTLLFDGEGNIVLHQVGLPSAKDIITQVNLINARNYAQ